MKALVWLVATYGCVSWTLIKNEETRLGAFDERTEKNSAGFMDSKETEWVLIKAGVKRELLDTVKVRKLAFGHTMRIELPGERDNARNNATIMPDGRRRGRPRTAWMDNQDVERTPRQRVYQCDRGQR